MLIPLSASAIAPSKHPDGLSRLLPIQIFQIDHGIARRKWDLHANQVFVCRGCGFFFSRVALKWHGQPDVFVVPFSSDNGRRFYRTWWAKAHHAARHWSLRFSDAAWSKRTADTCLPVTRPVFRIHHELNVFVVSTQSNRYFVSPRSLRPSCQVAPMGMERNELLATGRGFRKGFGSRSREYAPHAVSGAVAAILRQAHAPGLEQTCCHQKQVVQRRVGRWPLSLQHLQRLVLTHGPVLTEGPAECRCPMTKRSCSCFMTDVSSVSKSMMCSNTVIKASSAGFKLKLVLVTSAGRPWAMFGRLCLSKSSRGVAVSMTVGR